MPELLYKEECFALVGAAMEVHSELGTGFHEPIFQEALAHELTDRGIPFKEQHEIGVRYKQRILKQTFKADYIAYEKILIEIKALPQLGAKEEAQLLNDLRASGMKLGLLINFGSLGKLEWQRMVN